MGLPDNSFDFALARYVFWTLPNPDTAAREVRRVLKPGGKLIITDFDQQIYYVLDPLHSKHELAIKKLEEKSTKLGGNNFVGRHLLRILKQAGFEELELEALTLHSDQFDVETLMKIGLDPDWMTQVFKFGLLKEELQEIRLATEQFIGSGDSIAMFTYLMACGKKPLDISGKDVET
jgi:SAM-dependent methyltransferase